MDEEEDKYYFSVLQVYFHGKKKLTKYKTNFPWHQKHVVNYYAVKS